MANPLTLTHNIMVRLPEDLHARLAAMARSQDRPMAWVVRRAIEAALDAEGA